MFLHQFIDLLPEGQPDRMHTAGPAEAAYAAVNSAGVQGNCAFYRLDYIEQVDILRRSAELEPAFDTPEGLYDACLYEPLEDLCKKAFRRGHFPCYLIDHNDLVHLAGKIEDAANGIVCFSCYLHFLVPPEQYFRSDPLLITTLMLSNSDY